MSASFLPHPSPHNTNLLYQVGVAGEERCRKRNEKKAYQTHTSAWNIWFVWPFTLSYLVPPPGRGHGANLKGASYLKPWYFLWLPHSLSPRARSESEFSTFTTTSHLVLLSLKIIFSFISLFVPSWTLSRVLQFLFTNGHLKGWVCTSFWIFLCLSHSFTLRTTKVREARGPFFLFKLILLRPLEADFSQLHTFPFLETYIQSFPTIAKWVRYHGQEVASCFS